MFEFDDTIAAISTAQGTGAIAVIRLSGARAVEIAQSILRCKSRLSAWPSHRAHLATVVEQAGHEGEAGPSGRHRTFLDEAVVTIFRKPNSYTREDVVEISCHGSLYLAHRILALLVDRGARLARSGEFTERAFLNGRFDLAQAEAVADIIAAKTAASLRAAVNQFQGALSDKIRTLRAHLVEVCSLLELELDFAEEDIEVVDKREVLTRLTEIEEELEGLLQSYERGKIFREGAKLTIVGRPNVGKSSLLNALLKEDRAIVTDIPGTTRDVLEEQLDIRGMLFRVIDTAGLRESGDVIEREGVRRSFREAGTADLVLFVIDASQPLGDEDVSLLGEVSTAQAQSGRAGLIMVLNKSDLQREIDIAALRRHRDDAPIVMLSAKTHDGLPALEEALVRVAVSTSGGQATEVMLNNVRQKDAIEKAVVCLREGKASTEGGLSSEFIAQSLREATQALGEIIGEVTTEELLQTIFSRFCIGK